jgi:hypothetical protein
MPEFGITGIATVLAIEPSPPIVDGPGNIVTGTFRHEVDQVTNLFVEGQNKPIGCTDTHPFWSVDRQEFVPVAHLQPGERLRLFNGETARIIQKLPRPGPTCVYNIEVYGEHVYEVTEYGILVHNVCWSTARKNFWKDTAKAAGASDKYSPKNLKRMEEGSPPMLKAKVKNNKTGDIEEVNVSMELHHRDIPQRDGGEGVHEVTNLDMLTPWEHEAADAFRHTGYTFIEIITSVKKF